MRRRRGNGLLGCGRSLRGAVVAGVVLAASLGVVPVATAGSSEISVAISAPASGATVSGVVVLTAETEGPVSSVGFDWSRDGGLTWSPIGSATSGAEGWSASWQTAGLSGPVILRATAAGGSQAVTATEPITLANAPSVGAVAHPVWFNPKAAAPGGDITVTLTASAELTGDVTVVRASTGRAVATLARELSIPMTGTSVSWNGRAGGAVVPDGAYRVEVLAGDGAGDLAWSTATVEIDTSPPSIAWRSIWPEPLRTTGEIHLAFRLGDNLAPTLRVRATVRGTLGVIRVISGLVRAPGDRSARWLPRYANGGALLPGTYWVRLAATDPAGNRARTGWRAFRVLRPVTTRVYAGFSGVGRTAALTFDDCNDPTAWASILDTLQRLDVRASFFCIGERVAEYPALARRTAAGPYTIGNHTWDHAYLPGLSASAVRTELARTDDAWWGTARVTPAPFFRPPYGSYDSTVLQAAGALGYARAILWSVDPRDWTEPGVSAIRSRVLTEVAPGDIVLLHVQSETAAALPGIVAGLRARGYRLVNLARLFQLAGQHESTAIPGPRTQVGPRTG